MAYTDDQFRQWFKDNPNATDLQITQIAAQAGVSAEQLARVTGRPLQEIFERATSTPSASNLATYSPITSQISQRQQEINDWVYNHEPLQYQQLYTALQSGKAKAVNDPEMGDVVVDANGKVLEGVSVNPKTGQITVPTSNGNLFVNTQVTAEGILSPIAPENYNKQVSYQSNGNDWDQYGGLVLAAAGMLGAPYLSTLIGGATGLTGAALTGATGATIGGLGSALTGGDPLKGALLGGLGGYIGGSVMGSGASPDLGMNSNLTMAQIESGLGTPGYGYGAQAASSGLFNPASIGAGAYMDFNGVPTAYAPDNIDIGGGYNPATGMSGDIPQADYSNEGRNYPTVESTQGSGGSPINASTAAKAAGAGLTASQIAQLTKAGLGLLGAGVAGSALSGGTGGAGSIPTQRVPEYTPGYYQDIQRYYDAYMPAVPRDVVSPLQSWYDTGYNGYTGNITGNGYTGNTIGNVSNSNLLSNAQVPSTTPSVLGSLFLDNVVPASSVPTVTTPVSVPVPAGQGLFSTGGTPVNTNSDTYKAQVAAENARKAKLLADLDAYVIPQTSQYYQYAQNLSSVPRMSGETDLDVLRRMKSMAMEVENRQKSLAQMQQTPVQGGFGLTG